MHMSEPEFERTVTEAVRSVPEPHERICATHAQMIEQIRKTVLHELGHYFGFDDKYLHSHGY